MNDDDFVRERSAVLEALATLARADPRLEGLWLQGSLARGDADPMSDIDAYVAVRDDALDDVFAGREALLGSIRPVLAWSDATVPGLKAMHALLAGGVRLDLFFEPASQLASQKRPAIRLLVDKTDLASRLVGGWEAPAAVVGRIVAVIVRMTRQGGTWPLRLLRRGQWSTFAMMELDLINAQLAQLMAVQADPANFYQNPLSLPRRLTDDQRRRLDALTDEALEGLARRDTRALLATHLKLFDALVAEARAACRTLGIDYPIAAEGDAAIRRLLEDGWPD